MPLIDDALSALSDLEAAFDEEGELGSHLFLYSQRGRSKRERWQRISMDSSLARRFAETIRMSVANTRARAVEEDGLQAFDFDSMASGSIGVMPIAEAPELQAWLDELPEPDWPSIFRGEPGFVDRAKFYAVDLRVSDGRQLRAFRSKSGIKIIIERGSRLAAMFRQDSDEMQSVQGTVLTFDENLDFFQWEGFLFIRTLGAFESVTNIRAITAMKACSAVDAIASRFAIPDAKGLKDHLSSRIKLAKKMAAAVQHGLLEDVDGSRLIARIDERGFGVKCRRDGDRFAFDLDLGDRRQIEEFVNLMTDVYLRSPVTEREWKVTSKRPA